MSGLYGNPCVPAQSSSTSTRYEKARYRALVDMVGRLGTPVKRANMKGNSLGHRLRRKDILPPFRMFYSLGYAADIIVYDQATLGLQYDSPVYATDFPGGERRIIQKAKGIRYTIVNGVVTFEEGTVCTGATPGKLLRSYDMVSR